MAGVNKFGQTGIGTNVKFGKTGSRIKETGGQLEARNAGDTGLVPFRAGTPIGDNDVVTKGYLEKTADVRVVGEIYDNTGVASNPTTANVGDIYIAKDTVGLFTANNLYRFINSVVIASATAPDFEEITPTEALKITVSDSLPNGGFTLSADHIYIWDTDGSSWVDIGPAAAIVDNARSEKDTLLFSEAPSKVLENVPAGASVVKATVKVTTPFDGAATLTIGDAGDTDAVMTIAEIDLLTAGTYVAECLVEYGVATDVIAYLGGSPTTGAATIELAYVTH